MGAKSTVECRHGARIYLVAVVLRHCFAAKNFVNVLVLDMSPKYISLGTLRVLRFNMPNSWDIMCLTCLCTPIISIPWSDYLQQEEQAHLTMTPSP